MTLEGVNGIKPYVTLDIMSNSLFVSPAGVRVGSLQRNRGEKLFCVNRPPTNLECCQIIAAKLAFSWQKKARHDEEQFLT